MMKQVSKNFLVSRSLYMLHGDEITKSMTRFDSMLSKAT